MGQRQHTRVRNRAGSRVQRAKASHSGFERNTGSVPARISAGAGLRVRRHDVSARRRAGGKECGRQKTLEVRGDRVFTLDDLFQDFSPRLFSHSGPSVPSANFTPGVLRHWILPRFR